MRPVPQPWVTRRSLHRREQSALEEAQNEIARLRLHLQAVLAVLRRSAADLQMEERLLMQALGLSEAPLAPIASKGKKKRKVVSG